MYRNSSKLGAALLAVSLATGVAHAGESTLDSYLRARKVLDQAVAVSGGAEKLNSIKTLTLDKHGTSHARNQSPTLAKPFHTSPTRVLAVLDLEKGWGMLETTGSFPGGLVFSGRQIYKGSENLLLDLLLKTSTVTDQPQVGVLDPTHRLFPPLMLRKMLQRVGTLRWVGNTELDGVAQDVVSFTWENGSLYTIYFDQKTHLMTRYELLFPDALTGDAFAALAFSDYRQMEGFPVPETIRQIVAGDLLNEWKYTQVEINKPIDESLFSAPKDYEAVAQQAVKDVEWVELGEGVYEIKNVGQSGYNMLVVAFADHSVAVEAPISQQVAATAIALVKEKLPSKPLRAVVLTHHHDDHTGGIGAFAAEGIEVIAVAENHEFLTKVASSFDTLTPGAPVPNSKTPRFQAIEGKLILSDAANTLELHDIGPSPHAKSMLIAYVPKAKVVFQADQYFKAPAGPLQASTETLVHFAKSLEALGLKVEKIAAVHGETATLEDVKSSLAKPAAANVVGQAH